MVPTAPSLVRFTEPAILRFGSSFTFTARFRSALGSEGLKKPGSIFFALSVKACSGISAKGASTSWPVPSARAALPLASITVRCRSPPACSVSCAPSDAGVTGGAGWPGGAAGGGAWVWLSVVLKSSL
jgi:hypothetical protein